MIPDITGNPPGCTFAFWQDVWSGWTASLAGDTRSARAHYLAADAMLSQGRLNPMLSVLRHNVGIRNGNVQSVEPTEDTVVGLYLAPRVMPGDYAKHILGEISEDHIAKFVNGLQPGHHADNIGVPQPHVMVMSTGRCGTMALYRLFRNSNLDAHHSYWFMVYPFTRWEMACRLFTNNHESFEAAAQWASTRAAEWLGEKPMIGLNHTDTIFAPVFAAIHKESKFVYLRRDPEKVFKSFHTKNQWIWGSTCFQAVGYDFDGGYRFALPCVDEEDGIRYHIEQTEKFCRTFGNVMGDRWIEISADRLFAQDKDEIARLLEFTGSDISLDNAVEHFKTPINVKAHKVCQS